jgi:uncharacterized protein
MMDYLSHVDWLSVGVWTLTVVMMIVGLIGSAMPLLPGPVLIFAAALLHKLFLPESGLTWWAIAVMMLLVLLAYALDFVSSAVGSRWAGGSKWGIFGVFIGALVGLFFGPVGWIAGPLIGSLLFEMALAQKDFRTALHCTWGTLLGTGAGLVLRSIVALGMVGVFAFDAWS